MNFMKCKHLRRDDDFGTPFCADCGLQFDDEVMFVNDCHDLSSHYDRNYNNETKREVSHHIARSVSSESESDSSYCTDSDSDFEPITPIPTPDPTLKPTPIPTPEPAPKNVKDLIKLAKERGIKYSTTMSKKDLCAMLGVEITKEPKVILRCGETGEERKFYSIYKASKETGVNPGLIHYYIKTNKELKIGETTYTVSKV